VPLVWALVSIPDKVGWGRERGSGKSASMPLGLKNTEGTPTPLQLTQACEKNLGRACRIISIVMLKAGRTLKG